MSKSKIFYSSAGYFIAGIGIASFLPPKLLENRQAYFALALFFALNIMIFKPVRAKAAFVCAAALFMGLWLYSLRLPRAAPDEISHYSGKELAIRGTVEGEAERRGTFQKAKIRVYGAAELPGRKIGGKILLTTEMYPALRHGDRIEFFCRLEKPEKFDGFSYDRYLARFGIYALCYFPQIISVSSPEDPGPAARTLRRLHAFKDRCRDIISASLPPDRADLARAMLLGDKLPSDSTLRQDFARSGLSHIAVISGLHITIVLGMLLYLGLSLGLGRRASSALALASLFAYLALIGLQPSALRSGLMGALALLALESGRLGKLGNLLLLSAAVLLAFNPLLLRDDVGFQLSYLALIGIIYAYPLIKKMYAKLPGEKFTESKILKGTGEALAVTLSAQAVTAPILYYNFGSLSLIAPLANILVLWMVPALTVLLIAGLALGLLIPSWSSIFFLPAGFLLEYLIRAAAWCANFNFAAI